MNVSKFTTVIKRSIKVIITAAAAATIIIIFNVTFREYDA